VKSSLLQLFILLSASSLKNDSIASTSMRPHQFAIASAIIDVEHVVLQTDRLPGPSSPFTTCGMTSRFGANLHSHYRSLMKVWHVGKCGSGRVSRPVSPGFCNLTGPFHSRLPFQVTRTAKQESFSMRIRCNGATLIVWQANLYFPRLVVAFDYLGHGDYSLSILPSDHDKIKSWHASQPSSSLNVHYKF
jgi:hypothetical protein